MSKTEWCRDASFVSRFLLNHLLLAKKWRWRKITAVPSAGPNYSGSRGLCYTKQREKQKWYYLRQGTSTQIEDWVGLALVQYLREWQWMQLSQWLRQSQVPRQWTDLGNPWAKRHTDRSDHPYWRLPRFSCSYTFGTYRNPNLGCNIQASTARKLKELLSRILVWRH